MSLVDWEDVSPRQVFGLPPIKPEPKSEAEPSRKGDWIETFTGKAMYPLDPRPEEIDIIDIAHSLSLKTRFNGQCRRFYSVAEHAVRCAVHAIKTNRAGMFALNVLHHDSSEAYLPDVPRPLKPYLTNFQEIEDGISKVINQHFGIPELYEDDVKDLKHIDTVLLATEARDLMMPGVLERWNLRVDPLPQTIRPWTRLQAEERFYFWHKLLTEHDDPENEQRTVYAVVEMLDLYGAV